MLLFYFIHLRDNVRNQEKHFNCFLERIEEYKICLIIFLTFKEEQCSSPQLSTDEYCNDENNTPECNFDGGACCGSDVKTDFCSDCECKEGTEPFI